MLKNTDIAMLKHLAYKFTSSDNYFNPKFVSDLIDTANDEGFNHGYEKAKKEGEQ